MEVSAHLALTLRFPEDVLWARQEIKRFCAALPFRPEDVERIGLAVSELAANMVTHAHGGRLFVNRIERLSRQGVQILAVDRGPGIADLASALKPGVSTVGTFGDGLAAVQDVMDKFEIASTPGQGTRIEVEKWVA